MMDLIDRSEVQYKMIEILPEADSLEWYEQARPDEVKDLVDELYSIVLNVIRIDAQPVKHGRFVFEKGDYINTVDGYRCTSCGETYHTKVPYFSEYKFCPNCGAKMDGDADER